MAEDRRDSVEMMIAGDDYVLAVYTPHDDGPPDVTYLDLADGDIISIATMDQHVEREERDRLVAAAMDQEPGEA